MIYLLFTLILFLIPPLSHGESNTDCHIFYARLEPKLKAQWDATEKRHKVSQGGINLSGEFKRPTRTLSVTSPNSVEKQIIIFGAPYKKDGVEYVDIAEADNRVLERIEFQNIYRDALASDFYLEVEQISQKFFLPSKKRGALKGRAKLELFEFRNWTNKNKTEAELQTPFGERKRVSLEDIFRASLIAQPGEEPIEVATFLKNGGRGDIFLTDAEVNPSYHGLAILVKKWPTQSADGSDFLANEKKRLIDKLLNERQAVVYMLGNTAYRGAAGHGTLLSRNLENQLLAPVKDVRSILLVTKKTVPDTLVHEGVHLHDFSSKVLKESFQELDSAVKKAKVPRGNKDLKKNLEMAKHFAMKVVMEQRAYAAQVQYLAGLESMKILEPEVVRVEKERILRNFQELYLKNLNKYLNKIKTSDPEVHALIFAKVKEHTVANDLLGLRYNPVDMENSIEVFGLNIK